MSLDKDNERAMLRITIRETAKGQTFQLEGKLVGPWVEEFARAWQGVAPSLGAKRLRLDLRDVSFIDPKGRQPLREIYQETEATFLAASPLTRHFADEAKQNISENGKKGA